MGVFVSYSIAEDLCMECFARVQVQELVAGDRIQKAGETKALQNRKRIMAF